LRILLKIGLFWLIPNFVILAQDYQFSQFYAVPLYYNPAFAGASLKTRGIVAYRNQWPGMGGWKGWTASFDGYLKNASSGIGVSFSQNFVAQTGYSQSNGMLQYSYRARWRKDVRMCFGMGIGFSRFSWNLAGGTMGDQLKPDNILPRSNDPLAAGSISAGVFDLQMGILFYSKNWWASLSGLHPHSPSYFLQAENTLDPRINLSGGYRLILEKRVDYKNQETPVSLTPALLIRSQGNSSQLDAGIYYHKPPFVAGIWYRGIPVPTGKLKTINNDASTLLFGIKQNNLTMGYSYDIPLNRAVSLNRGSHEITLGYEFSAKNLHFRGKNRSKALPCPTF
jgi:type IX secretion system PorP/SprF family membrane protein